MPVSAIRAEGVSMDFGSLRVLHGINVDVSEGEVVAVLGPSGSGKSTLLRCLSWLTPPTEGAVYLQGERLGVAVAPDGRQSRLSAAKLARQRSRIGMVFQSFNLWPHLTVLGNITEGPVQVLGLRPGEARERAMTILETVGLAAKASAYPATLSGGQQQRVAIARALAMQPELLLFDEPTSSLDPELVGEVLDVIELLAARRTTMVVVTHEIAFASEAATRVIFMDGGRIVEDTLPATFFRDPAEERSRRFLERTLRRYAQFGSHRSAEG
ncbi:MAG: amino acid ABC transporter ATP-binding protein [Ancalomicrobiaceae bacterium]|nr:amino acid ABC transporter ATP-binding protein [Ancalomicrobiaceae bacterium]